MAQPTPEQANYLNVLEDMANMLKKVQINLKKCYWNTFNHANSNLMKCTPREQRGILPYFLNEEFYTYEELYLCLQGDLTELLSSFESQPKTADTLISSQINQASFAKLPRIQLPIFTGKYEDWPSYQDLFTALVHDTSLSDVQKLYYLKTSVSGEAEMLLRQFQITGNNYLYAWKLLQDRFGNKRMMINSILGRIFGQKKIANQSPNTIKSLLDTTTACINSLNELNVSTATWSPIIVFLISQKLDQESLKDWEEHTYKENYDELPSWEGMKKFLEYKFRT
ncbi:hypothetical protein K1T71_006196 [Dendrolimus kikuchii]|uniref:Uncharacterized protein n=1 Tax=Dendrolimus kikuchii TaxID=765133 RepID=A0ACC1D383_9NEOP|nr:hypothetical protein K1T71_006196 [Dendrolimus kikuchii]